MSLTFIPQAYAQCDSTAGGLNLGDCLTLNGTDKVSDYYSTPADLINIIVPVVFVGGGLILFLMIMYSGFKFIQSGSKGKDEAKTIMTAAIVGFIVMFSAYWIVRIVSTITGQEIPL